MTDAGVNSTITTFDHGGQQYLVVHAGGGVFANGERVYREACLPCHGADGDGGEGGGASLLTGLTVETAVAVGMAGRNNMPVFRDAYSIDELCDVATFIVERLAAE